MVRASTTRRISSRTLRQTVFTNRGLILPGREKFTMKIVKRAAVVSAILMGGLMLQGCLVGAAVGAGAAVVGAGASVVGAGVDAVTTSDEETRAKREREQRRWEREQRRCERRQQQGKTC